MRYLQLRNNTYYFRYVIPQRFRGFYPFPEIKYSLHTNCFAQAVVKIASKLDVIRRIKSMSSSHPSLSQLFAELTDYSVADGLPEHERHERDGGAAVMYDVMSGDIRSSLKNGGGNFNPSDYGLKTNPPADIFERREFESLALMLSEAQIERICNGRSEAFGRYFNNAQNALQSVTMEKKAYLLSEAWSDFCSFKRDWSDKQSKHNNRMYSVLLSYWGDVDVKSVSKQMISDVLNRFQDFPKGNIKPYNKMEVVEILAIDESDIADESKISSKTVQGMLKLLQSFFSAFLAREKGVLESSPTMNISYVAKSPRYAAYSDTQVLKIKRTAIGLDGWKKWVLLLAIYTGARRGDISGISTGDVRKDDDSGRYYIWVDSGKTEAAQRKIPIHQELINLGFLEFASAVGGILFPEVISNKNAMTRLSSNVNHTLGIGAYDEKGQRYVFHSFRHTFITKVTSLGVATPLMQTVVGHEKSESGISKRYTHDMPLKSLLVVVDSIVDW